MKKIGNLKKVVELMNNGYEIHKNIYRDRTDLILFPTFKIGAHSYELSQRTFEILNTVNRLQIVGECEHGTVYSYYKT